MKPIQGPQTVEARIELCQAIEKNLTEAIHAKDEASMWRCIGWINDLERALAQDLPTKPKG